MRLFEFVEEDDGIRAAADLLGQLSGLVIADIAGRRADDLRDAVLFHILGHIEPDERLDRLEHLAGQPLDELRLAHAGGADKDERDRMLLDLDADARAADGGNDGGDGLVLTDDVLFERRVEVQQLLIFLCADLAGRDLGPELDDAGQIVDGEDGLRQLLELCDLGIELQIAAAQLRHAGVVVLRLLGVLGQHAELEIVIGVLLAERFKLAEILVFEVDVRAGLVDEVDGLVGQEAVGDIALRKEHGLPGDLGRDDDAVEGLIVVADAADDGDGLLDGRLGHGDGLEAALERGILFDVLAVLVECCRADNLDLAAGQGGLEDVGSVHRAFGITRADEIVDLVDDKDDIAQLFDLLHST